MKCPLCGFEFHEYKNVCQGCVLKKDCQVVCCPNCHYQFPAESKLTSWVQKILKKDI